MGLEFNFSTATQIIFGNGTIEQTPGIVKGLGDNVLIVTGKNINRANVLIVRLKSEDVDFSVFQVEMEPTIDIIDQGVGLARKNRCNVVIGLGGGSVIDSAKAIAALTSNEGELINYLEVIGKGEKLKKNPMPFIAIPTTAGTGAEVTKNAVIHSPVHKVKVSLRSPLMVADVALVDPGLTLSMPSEVTAATGMDALTHLLETFVSNQSNPFIDHFCRDGMQRIARSLKKAFLNGNDLKAR